MIESLWVPIPAGGAGEFSSPGSTFCADSYFGIHSTSSITAAACERSQSFCQKCRWRITAKHAYTLSMWLCMKWHGCMVYTEFVLRRRHFHVGPSMPALQVHHFGGYSEMPYKKLVTHVESHLSAVRLLESRE